MALDPGFQKHLRAESWSLFGIAIIVYFLRLYTRMSLYGGLRALKADDFVMTFAILAYTANVTALNLIASGGGSNLYYPEELSTFSPEEIVERIKGSKIVLVSEQAMLCCIWSIKACMLIFYSTLTTGLQAKRIVKSVTYYVAVGWIACELAMFFQCRPFSGYWAVPPPVPDCTTFYSYAIVNAVFNISSDIMMMCIPLPLLIRSRLPIKQKIAVCVVFLMGMFVITAAVLTKVFNLSDEYSTIYMLWYIRESSVAVYVSNLPIIWPLIRRFVPGLGGDSQNRSTRSKYNGAYGPSGEVDVEMSASTASRLANKRSKKQSKPPDATLWEEMNDSQEELANAAAAAGTKNMNGIRHDVTFTIETEERVGWEPGDEKKGSGVFVTETGEAPREVEYSVAVKTES